MPVTINGTTGIVNNATDLNYTGTLTGGTGVINIGSGQFYKDASGRIGLGTTSPLTSIDIASASSVQIRGSVGANVGLFGIRSDDGSTEMRSVTGAATFHTSNIERARFSSGGEWMVQCTGLTGDAPNTAGGTLKQDNGNTKIRVTGNGTAAFQFYSPGGGTGGPVGSVVVNSGSVSYNTTSDYRLKENVQPLTGGLARVAALKPCTYVWKATGEKAEGFIAHELQEVCPDAVTGEKDGVDEAGNPKYQGIDTSFLVATLTAAIQELKAELDSVKAELATLKGAQA